MSISCCVMHQPGDCCHYGDTPFDEDAHGALFSDGERVQVTLRGTVDDDSSEDSVGIIVDGTNGWRAIVPAHTVKRLIASEVPE